MWTDPEWIAYVAKSADLAALVRQENKILIAAPFFKLPGA